MDLLPDDLLIDILGRLPPFSLAASRCVCKNWCSVIDTRHLLRADLLPVRLDGFFLMEDVPELYSSMHFFSRPSTACKLSICLDFLPRDVFNPSYPWILDHCNGLLLFFNLVVNPATRQWVSLPLFPDPCDGMENFYDSYFLAYDPMVSPHYDVVLTPSVPSIYDTIEFQEECEWPPSLFTTQVFSSRKWRWEERSFVREGKAVGTVADMHCNMYEDALLRHAVYLRGALYVHCQNDAVMSKYQMIKSPQEKHAFGQGDAYLGKSQKGVYYASKSLESSRPHIRVWLLNESGSEMEWILKCDVSLQTLEKIFSRDYDTDKHGEPWVLNYKKDADEAWTEEESEWDFEGGIVLHETKDEKTTTGKRGTGGFLGFHPYKEIFFLQSLGTRVLSYNLNSSKVQELGILGKGFIVKSFPYTPSRVEFFENK